jgi:hypothetical protein
VLIAEKLALSAVSHSKNDEQNKSEAKTMLTQKADTRV